MLFFLSSIFWQTSVLLSNFVPHYFSFSMVHSTLVLCGLPTTSKVMNLQWHTHCPICFRITSHSFSRLNPNSRLFCFKVADRHTQTQHSKLSDSKSESNSELWLITPSVAASILLPPTNWGVALRPSPSPSMFLPISFIINYVLPEFKLFFTPNSLSVEC